MLAVRNVHLTVGILIHTEQLLRYMFTKIGQELLIYNHLLASRGIFAHLLRLVVLCDCLLLAHFAFNILSSWLMICLGLAISCILSLLEELDVGGKGLV